MTRRTMVAGSAIATVAGGLVAWQGTETAEAATAGGPGPTFALTVAPSTKLTATAGRAFVIIARASDLSDDAPEPRDNLQGGEPISIPLFGMDVPLMQPGTPMVLRSVAKPAGGEVVGYPLASFADIPAGDYVVQGFFNTYETDHRSDDPRRRLREDHLADPRSGNRPDRDHPARRNRTAGEPARLQPRQAH
jgi:hypothetical protein